LEDMISIREYERSMQEIMLSRIVTPIYNRN